MSSSTFTRQPYGAWYKSDSYFGGQNGGAPGFDGEIANATTFVSDLSNLKALGARGSFKVVGPATNYGKGGPFSLANWKTSFDAAVARTNASQMSSFFADGTFIGHMMLDDLSPGGAFTVEPTFAEIDEMARYSKSKWSVPTSVRVHGTYLKSIVTRSKYSYLDYCWNQWHERFGSVGPWYQTNTADARSVGLGSMQGFNLLNGGSGLTAPWNVLGGGDPGSGQYGMSPQEIDACANGFSQLTTSIGIIPWAHQANDGSTTYWNTASIQTALSNCFNKAIGHLAGPFNWRGDLAGSSSETTAPSNNTVVGGWGAIVASNGFTRIDDAATLSVPMPGVSPGNIICIQAYSRDNTYRTAVVPSGWSEAARVSGNSALGGELVLLFKEATGGEGGTNQAVTFTGPGAAGSTGGSMMARAFAFSGGTSGTLLSGIGSDSTWTSNWNMGPVRGPFVSTISDAVILICAAKANDFGSGSVDIPTTTMSGTTSDGETWSRLFILSNGAGSDSGMFCDYAFTAGLPSITTKSWSQTTSTTNGSAGAGCGFFVAFAPLSIISGQPPVMSETVDWNTSVGSTVSFTIQSTGSTPITYSKDSAPSSATFSSTGQFNFTAISATTYVIVLKATNAFGSDTNTFRIFASTPSSQSSGGVGGGSNHVPDITHPGNKTVAAHDLLSFVVNVNDIDGDVITIRTEGAPAGTYLDPSTGQFVWIPRGDQGPGTYGMAIVASDGQAESRSTFTITVTDTPWTRYGGPASQTQRLSTSSNGFTRI